MGLSHSMSVLHCNICVIVKCARVQLYRLLSSEVFLETGCVPPEPTLLSRFLKK